MSVEFLDLILMIEIEEIIRLIDRYRTILEAVRSADFQNAVHKGSMGTVPYQCTSSIYVKLLTLEQEMNYLDSVVKCVQGVS